MAKSPSSSRKPLPSSPARCTRSSSKSEPASEVGDRTRRPEAERKRREEEKPAQETPASKRPRSGAAEERKTPVKSSGKKQRVETPSVAVKEEEAFDGGSGESCEEEEVSAHEARRKVATKQFVSRKAKNNRQEDAECVFLDDIPRSEAERRWPDRYRKKAKGSPNSEEDDDLLPAVNHYEKANVDGVTYQLDDDVHVKAEEGKDNYIGRIVELFASTDGKQYFSAQWYFRAEDTVIGECNEGHDRKRVFLSEEKNTNLLDCIVSKIVIIRVDMLNKYTLPPCDYYYDMMYSLPYTSFTNLPSESTRSRRSPSSSTVTTDVASETIKEEVSSVTSATLLDLYSGCGAMSTGLCMGAHLSGLKLQTGWAVDINADACSSLQLNHPETKVSNMTADDYLGLLKEWNKLCTKYMFSDNSAGEVDIPLPADEEDSKSNDDSDEEFEVDKFLDLCYGDPANCGIVGLKLKVRWKGYGPDEDSWEPIENLGACDEKLQEFVRWGCEQKILPCPGDVDVICGGPPCQGISGFNRFRDRENPLKDVKNKQIVTFFDIVDYLKPKYVLMENVVDLLKFAKGYLGRYAISRLLKMNYQSRLGIMAAGCYGLPQFRGRAFLWGALSHEKLPQFPLPSHHVVVRGVIPTEFEQNLVAYDANQLPKLKDAQRLVDAIADLPKVSNDEDRDVMSYDKPPQTDFQRYIRLSKDAMMGGNKKHCHDKLFDHRPLKLNTDDYQRVQRIPFKKGANFRDLPGLRVREDNVVELDPDVERVYLPSGKPLVPDYAISFIKGKSLKPFGRLWWDEIVPTVVTRAEPHNQVILHPDQARVLTIRENARLQGFPDHYQLRGSIKERYKQVGNAVAVPAARALGYALGKAFMGVSNDDGPVLTLPKDLLSI